jgi:hypothetical protein
METFFRQTLYRWRHFQGDMTPASTYYVTKSYTETGMGISIKEETAATDAANNIVSHDYKDQLDTEEKVDALKMPVVQAQPEKDQENLAFAQEVLDGILPVELGGHAMWYNAWDIIVRFRGITNCLLDMVDRPELIHKTIQKFEAIYTSRYTQMAEQGLFDEGTPTAAPQDRLKDKWFNGAAQLMVSASPEMNWEFNLQYLKSFMERCGHSIYGCCEPMHNFVPYLRRVSNVRQISASPFTNVRIQAENQGPDFVMDRKPNPAMVARNVNEDVIRADIKETIEICLETKTPFQFILKDISTVSYRPENLTEWERIVRTETDKYF